MTEDCQNENKSVYFFCLLRQHSCSVISIARALLRSSEKKRSSQTTSQFFQVLVFVENVFSVSSSSYLSEHTSEMLLKVVTFRRLPDLTSLQNICGVENKSLDGPVQKRNAYFSDTFARARGKKEFRSTHFTVKHFIALSPLI